MILLVTTPGSQHEALEEALRRAGVVLISADPDAAPGFLEASDWPGVRVAAPELVVALGPGSEALGQRLQATGVPCPLLTQQEPLSLDEVGGFVARALAHLRAPSDRESPR